MFIKYNNNSSKNKKKKKLINDSEDNLKESLESLEKNIEIYYLKKVGLKKLEKKKNQMG